MKHDLVDFSVHSVNYKWFYKNFTQSFIYINFTVGNYGSKTVKKKMLFVPYSQKRLCSNAKIML